MLGRFLIENLSINEEGGLDFEVVLTHDGASHGSVRTTYPVTISSADIRGIANMFASREQSTGTPPPAGLASLLDEFPPNRQIREGD